MVVNVGVVPGIAKQYKQTSFSIQYRNINSKVRETEKDPNVYPSLDVIQANREPITVTQLPIVKGSGNWQIGSFNILLSAFRRDK
ncbi:MAG: hypothetical protein ACOX63_09950 [Christensenellales bacterium]|jgi:hypothetical protein